MYLPRLKEEYSSRDMIDAFSGYNHNPRIGAGEFYDMENLTSDAYPVLTPRNKRGIYATPEHPTGLVAKDALCYVDGSDFVINGYHVDMGLSEDEDDCPKNLISMGAYVIIMPDKKYINTLDLTDFGKIEASFTTNAAVTFELSTIDGETYGTPTVSSTAPSEPANMAYWIDTSSTPHTLKQYSETSSMWMPIATTYVKISSPGIGAAFEQYDGVKISGIVKSELADLNNTMAIWAKGDGYIVVVGMLDAVVTQEPSEGAITIKRSMPNMDYLTESENRLWGCKYGVSSTGAIVNEIYACKLGDFKNWNCFMGVSTDSYAASVGTDGVFTGAITHLGYPLFFKEGFIHKVYGNFPANYQIQTTACRGVQRGCGRSLAIVNEVLYYKARHAVCAYDGSLPAEISSVLGEEHYADAVAGAHGNKYYISMRNTGDDTYSLFVYDTSKGLWHREDGTRVDVFCSCDEELYCIENGTNRIISMLGSGEAAEESVSWYAQTGDLYLSYPDMKYISRLTVRMQMEVGAEATFYAQYDLSEEWVKLCTIRGTDLRSFSIPIRPRRCDHMKLLIEGEGACKIYSIAKTVEEGSELS